MQNNQLKYWNAFSLIPKIGSARFKKLYSCFDDLEKAWLANREELKKTFLPDDIIEQIILSREQINVDAEFEKLEKENIKIITIRDGKYPKSLKEIHNPPALLFCKGELQNDELSIAVVGSRKITQYGQQATAELAQSLSQLKITVVSGMAIGVDTLAHQTALKNNARTIAVLGSGLDNQSIYPSINRYLAQKIVDAGGAVVTEYPFGTIPMKQNFPNRNRIISGLSLGTLVVEAGESSGALITARYALEQNREVFAVPGSIYSEMSKGPNKLIKLGAKTVTSADDILETLNLTQATEFITNKKIIPDSKEEEIILKHLTKEPIHIDKLTQASKLKTNEVSSILTLMEMKGKVKNLGGMNYVLAR